MRRLLELTIITCWLFSLAALVWHDVWPAWTAGSPPTQVPTAQGGAPIRMQFAISARMYGPIGQSWTEFWRIESGAVARSTTRLKAPFLPRTVLVESHLGFDKMDHLDELKLWVSGLAMKVEVEAASYGEDFPCIITIGEQRHTFTLRQDMASVFAEVLRPFVYLKGLHVGQTWRIASINPLGSLWGEDPSPQPVVAKVVGREPIEHLGRTVDCFRVQTQGAVAWVDDEGQVLLQEVDLPMLGKVSIRLLDGFDEEALQQARGVMEDTKQATTTSE